MAAPSDNYVRQHQGLENWLNARNQDSPKLNSERNKTTANVSAFALAESRKQARSQSDRSSIRSIQLVYLSRPSTAPTAAAATAANAGASSPAPLSLGSPISRRGSIASIASTRSASPLTPESETLESSTSSLANEISDLDIASAAKEAIAESRKTARSFSDRSNSRQLNRKTTGATQAAASPSSSNASRSRAASEASGGSPNVRPISASPLTPSRNATSSHDVKRKAASSGKADPNLMARIQSALSRNYVNTNHADQRSTQRTISTSDIHDVLTNGQHEVGRDRYEEKNQVWTYAVRGHTQDGKDLRVVVCFNRSLLVVRTVVRKN